MQDFTYHLEKYHGRDSRHECPQCGDKHSFTYYVDAAGNIIDKLVGRCNHESSCGYHYTPKEWFRDNPEERAQKRHRPKPQPKPQPRQPDYIDPDFVIRSASFDSDFVYYLCGLIPNDTIKKVWEDYAVGATKDGCVIYWQIDKAGKVRTGKIMRYNPATGHRIKEEYGINWAHYRLQERGQLPQSFNLVQCLFGERLLTLHPDKTVVALVEAEKTAVVCAALYPEFIWLATGGKTQLAPAKMKVLSGRRVIAFPDVDGFEVWKAKARDLAAAGINITVSDILEKNATPEERERNIDIADWLLEQLSQVSQCGTSGTVGHPVTVTAYNPARQLAEVIERWPRLAVLADRLKLELIDTSELL